MKWKTIIFILLLVFLIDIVMAEDIQIFIPNYGDSQLYVETTGDSQLNMYYSKIPPLAPVSTPAPAARVIVCEEGEFLMFGRCYLNIFKLMFEFWNQTIASKWFERGGGVLEYSIIVPRTVEKGEKLTIINSFDNEGNQPVEMNCYNFFDINNNGVKDSNDLVTNFNKRVLTNESMQFNTTINIPKNILNGRYFIGAECELLDSEQPDATAYATIEIGDGLPLAIIAPFDEGINQTYKILFICLMVVIVVLLAVRFGITGILTSGLAILLTNPLILIILIAIILIVLFRLGIIP